MKHHIFISLLILLGLMGCKNSPIFTADNELDPYHENYKIAPPKNLNLQVETYNGKYQGIYLRWDHPGAEYVIDGFLLKIYEPEKKKFIDLLKLGNDDDSYWEDTNQIPINIKYQLYSFINAGEDSIRVSEPQIVTYNQKLLAFKAEFFTDEIIELTWDHLIYSSKAKIFIEKSTNRNDFEPIQELNTSIKRFTEDVNLNLNDELIYRIYAKTDFEKSDTLYSEPIGFKAESPKYLKINSSTSSEINLNIGNPILADGYVIKILLPDQSIYSEIDVAATEADSTLITLNDLPNSEGFILEVQSFLKSDFSTPVSVEIQKIPYLNYQRTSYLPSSENYKPRISDDGSKIAFMNVSSNYDSYPVVWDIENSQNIISLTQANSPWMAFDFDSEEELIYTVDEDYIKIWNFKGNEENTLHHYANLDVIDMIAVPEKNKAALIYNGLLNVYNLQDNTLESVQAEGHFLLSSNSGEQVYVINTFRYFHIQKHDIDHISNNSRLYTDFTPQKVLIGDDDEVILISEEGVYIYDPSNFSLIKNINIEIEEIQSANLIHDNILAVYHGESWYNFSLDFIDLNTGQHLGSINLSELRSEINTDFPIFEDSKIFFSDTLNRIFIMSRNELTFFTLTHRWINITE